MSGTDGERLLRALDALRSGAEGRARERAWGTVRWWIDAHHAHGRDHDEVVQTVCLKLLGRLEGLDATTPGAAVAWVRQVYRRALLDVIRREKTRRTVPLEGTDPSGERGPAPIAGLEAKRVWGPNDHARFAEAMAEVIGRVEGWLAGGGRRRASAERARQDAELVLLARVGGREPEELAAHVGLDPVADRQNLQKRLQRGRDEVLLPMLDAWIGAEDVEVWVEELRDLLGATRRRDAGVAREGRRKPAAQGTHGAAGGNHGAPSSDGDHAAAGDGNVGATVSPRRHQTSVQRKADRKDEQS